MSLRNISKAGHSAYEKTLVSKFEELNWGEMVDLIPVDQTRYGTEYPTMLIAVLSVIGEQPTMVYSPMVIIPKGKKPLLETQDQVGARNGKITILHSPVVGVLGSEYANIAYNVLKSYVGDLDPENVKFVAAQPTIVDGNQFEIEDVANFDLMAFRNAAWVGYQAVVNTIEDVSGDLPDSEKLTKLIENDRRVVFTDTTPSENQSYDLLSQPRRADIRLEMATKTKNKVASGFINQGSTEIGNVGVYLDFIYNPQNIAPQQPMYGAHAQPVDIRQFQPLVVVNSVMSDDDSKATPEQHLLLTLSAIDAIGDNQSWKYLAWSRRNQENRSVGSLGIIANNVLEYQKTGKVEPYGDHVDLLGLDEQKFSATLEYMAAADRMLLGIECSSISGDSAITNLIAQASENGANSDAEKNILSRLDNMLNGLFLPEWNKVTTNKPTPAFIATGKVNFTGWFVEGGKTKDLAEIDTVWVYNRFGKPDKSYNGDIIVKWNELNFGSHNDTATTMSEKYNLIQDLTGGTAVIHGYKTVVIFNPVFVNIAKSVIGNLGVNIEYDRPFSVVNPTSGQLGNSALYNLGAQYSSALMHNGMQTTNPASAFRYHVG